MALLVGVGTKLVGAEERRTRTRSKQMDKTCNARSLLPPMECKYQGFSLCVSLCHSLSLLETLNINIALVPRFPESREGIQIQFARSGDGSDQRSPQKQSSNSILRLFECPQG